VNTSRRRVAVLKPGYENFYPRATRDDLWPLDLLRQAMYAEVPEARRRLLHVRMTETLDRGGEPTVVAEHWLAAGERERAGERWRSPNSRARASSR
jgi:hypothetical protein